MAKTPDSHRLFLKGSQKNSSCRHVKQKKVHETKCWLRTRLILVADKTSIPGSYRVIKNSARENLILCSLRILPTFWIQHPAHSLVEEKSPWHIGSRIVLWAFVIMTTKVLGLINLVHFIMKVQLHLQFANLRIWDFQLTCILIATPRLLSFHSDVVSDFFPFHFRRYDTEKPSIPTSYRWNIAGYLILHMYHMINWHLTSSNST